MSYCYCGCWLGQDIVGVRVIKGRVPITEYYYKTVFLANGNRVGEYYWFGSVLIAFLLIRRERMVD